MTMPKDFEKIKTAPERGEKPPAFQVLGWNIDYADDLPSGTAIDRGERRILVRWSDASESARARQVGILAVAREEAFVSMMRETNTKKAIEIFSKDPDFTRELLRFRGAKILRDRDPQIAQEVAQELSPASTAVSEFQLACALYLATGEFPPTTEAVRTELERLPVSQKTNEHVLSALAGEHVTLSRKRDYFERFIVPALEQLKRVDADLRASSQEDFQPSTDSAETKELDESEIMQRVLPFVGGYFREKVMDAVDWESMRVVASGVTSERLQPPSEPPARDPDEKIHTFQGVDGKELLRERSAPLPEKAAVLPETLTGGFVIRRTVNGEHFLEWEGGGEPPETYEFQFARGTQMLDWQKKEPAEDEQTIPPDVIGTLALETRTFLEDLGGARITNRARVNQIAKRIQTTIQYVTDNAVGEALAGAGKGYFAELERLKKGDCDVSNFYALAQIRSLGIPCRMVTGYHIKKDKRFPFAAIAGVKHAWLEWWNEESRSWERIDATPPQEKDEESKKGKERGGGSVGSQMNESADENPALSPKDSDDDPWGTELTDDDLTRLAERIESSKGTGGDALRTEQIFQDLYGVPQERWEQVRELAERISRERIPREATIDKRSDSSVSEEWERIFQLLLVAYRLPANTRPKIARESQGGELVDPVSAGIDVLSGEDDPYGFRKSTPRERTEHLPIRFSNDFLLDITASMTAKNREGKSLLELERAFTLSSLYEGYKFNERIKQRAADLVQTPLITNHVLSIHGGGTWQEIVKTSPMSLKELVAVNEAMQKPTAGAGAMADAIERYAQTLEDDTKTVDALKKGEMLKTLTILTDGNLWCSQCGKESCSYELHGATLRRIQTTLKLVRSMGVIVNAIGFTEQSRPVTEIFRVEGDKEAAVVTENLSGALVAHHLQALRAMRPVVLAGEKRLATK